jgi:hypothetical protein
MLIVVCTLFGQRWRTLFLGSFDKNLAFFISLAFNKGFLELTLFIAKEQSNDGLAC